MQDLIEQLSKMNAVDLLRVIDAAQELVGMPTSDPIMAQQAAFLERELRKVGLSPEN